MSNIKKSLKWSAIERVCAQAIQLLTMLILGKVLGPEAFGLIAITMIFIAIGQTLVDSGFSSALIRQTEVTEDDYSTAFIFNLIVSMSIYFILYFMASKIAVFFERSELEQIIKVISFSIITNSFIIVQRTKMIINMDFKRLGKITLTSVILSSSVAIIMACQGQGYWALVAQTLISSGTVAVLLFINDRWIPKTGFNMKSFRYLFGFGSKLLLSALLETFYNNLYQILIGKLFTTRELGFFSQGKALTYTVSTSFCQIVQRVSYPALSKIQENEEQLSNQHRLFIEMSAFVFFLITGLIILNSGFLVNTILGKEWAGLDYIICILIAAYSLYPIHAQNLNLLNVKGRSDLFLKLEILKKIIASLILFLTFKFGVIYISIGILLESLIQVYINNIYTKCYSKYQLNEQVKYIIQMVLIVLFSLLIPFIILLNLGENIVTNTFSSLIFIVAYFFLSKLYLHRIGIKIKISRKNIINVEVVR